MKIAHRSARYVQVLNSVATIQYLLRDDFTDTRAAGAVNGTPATPGPGTRVVTDTGNRMSISGDVLGISAGGAFGDPMVHWNSIARSAGMALLIDCSVTSGTAEFGFKTSAGSTRPVAPGFDLVAGTGVRGWYGGGSNATTLAAIATGVSWRYAILLRATGYCFMYRPATDWLMLWADATSLSANLIPCVTGSGLVGNYGSARLVQASWIPTPLASDGFGSTFGSTDGLGHAEGIAGGIGSGGGSVAWTGSTWSVSAGKAINTPTESAELLTDGGLENWTSPTNLTDWTESVSGTSTINQENATTHGGSNAARFDIDATDGNARIGQSIAAAADDWVAVRMWARCSTTAASIAVSASGGGSLVTPVINLTTSYVEYIRTARLLDNSIGIKRNSAASKSIYLDDLSVKKLTLSSLFASLTVSIADVLADVAITLVSGTLAGLVLNLDSTSSPANFVIAYHDGANCKLEKCVAGVYTSVVSAAATYSANAVLRVSKIGTAYRLYYNNALVGNGTISDAGIISNTRHGLFSTYSGNQLDNFVVYASGTGGEYSNLNQYVS